MPEGTPYVFTNHPNPNLKQECRNKKKNNSQNDITNDETKRRSNEDTNRQDKKEKKHEADNERRDSLAERQGDIATSCPGAKRRQKRWGEGDGRWVWNKQWHAQPHKDPKEYFLQKGDGKLALAQDRTPSRGEPGEPRGSTTYQWTPSPELGGKRDMTEGRENKRETNSKRGIRNEATVEKRKENRNKHRGANKHICRTVKDTHRGDWQRFATEARRITTQPPKSAYKGDHKEQHKQTPNKTNKTRAGIIRSMNRTQRIPDKNKDPDCNIMKWKYGEKMKIASINVRGVRDPVKKRGNNNTNGHERNRHKVSTGNKIRILAMRL